MTSVRQTDKKYKNSNKNICRVRLYPSTVILLILTFADTDLRLTILEKLKICELRVQKFVSISEYLEEV